MEKVEQKAVSANEVAERYSLCLGTLGNMRSRKEGPRFFKNGKRVVYRPEDVEKWLFGSPVETIDSVQRRRRSV